MSSEGILNRHAIRPGDIISRYSGGPIAWAICVATGQWKINHDAIVIPNPFGTLCAGDALMGPGCQLTPLDQWERLAIHEGHKILVGRPLGSTAGDGMAAAMWWRDHINGKRYDRVALLQILRKRIFGTWWPAAVGLPTHFYCTEGVRDSWHNATTLRPWDGVVNVTPGTTVDSYDACRIVEVPDAFTEYGQRYKVSL